MSLLNGLGNAMSTVGGELANAEIRHEIMPSLLGFPTPATSVAVASGLSTQSTTPPTIAALMKAFTGQESGGRQIDANGNTLTSVTGAKGVGQIEPGTFAQYAKPGESIDNEADNRAVMERILTDLWNKSGGDPARVAVGYFSGPGNIAPSGNSTPWLHDRADPNGKTTSSYVNDIMRRLANGVQPT